MALFGKSNGVKDWVLREHFSDDFQKQLLISRGIKTDAEAESFFHPDYVKHLFDPFLMSDMDKAADRILKAVKDNERAVVFGDYDADGVCGTIMFYDLFKKIGYENFTVYIPDKHREGYGLNFAAIEEFKKDGVGLIITTDCGIADFEEIKKANELGIETVVTDHHPQLGKIPPAFAVVDPKKEGDGYPFKNLCGENYQ